MTLKQLKITLALLLFLTSNVFKLTTLCEGKLSDHEMNTDPDL